MPLNTTRRSALLAASALVGVAAPAAARTISGMMPWQPGEVYPPRGLEPAGGWLYLNADEAAVLEAIADRFIPPDERSLGGKDANCVIFIDRQLAGPYGRLDGWYMEGPFPADVLPTQGYQSPLRPTEVYRDGLRALATYVTSAFGNRKFNQLSGEDQDKVLTGLEKGEVKLEDFNGRVLFEQIYSNMMEGYFADPIYGGNKDMTGWKLLGFPGARYDYRDVIARPNQRYNAPPVGLIGRPDWGKLVDPSRRSGRGGPV
jgi:gluconate 2-dehydrogenase gamma chain